MAVGITLLAIGCLGQRLGWIAGFAAVLGILPSIFLVGSALVRVHEVATAVASFLSIVAFGLWGLRARRATALSAAIGGVLGTVGGLGGAGLWILAMINTSGRFPFNDTGVTELIWTATTLSAASALTLGGTLLLAPAGSREPVASS